MTEPVSDEERDNLIARMQSAETLHEMESAMEEARDWLRSHPGDDRVAAAMQRLEERWQRLSEPERELGWQATIAAAIVGLAVGAVMYSISGSWTYSIAAALFIGVELGFWGWGLTVGVIRRTRRNRSGR